ncbi:MAG TPA: transglutaminaseTgpA domain-containing protein [Acidimicrobiales bacterium]|nr:transglutaminaseTgpA domain-containing protein [Acidimicrobiales bacterium]
MTGLRRGALAGSGDARASLREWPVVAALVAATLAAAPGARGFLGPDRSLVPILVVAVLVHLASWAARRVAPSVSLVGGLVAILLAVAWTAFPGTTVGGLPLSATWKAAAVAVKQAVAAGAGGQIGGGDAVTAAGKLALAVLIVAVCAVMADQMALRIGRPLVALVPSLTVIVLGATRAPADHPVVAVSVWIVAAAAFLAAHHAWAGAPTRAPAGGRVRTFGATAVPAAALALAAALVGAAVASHLPGYGGQPLVKGAGLAAGRGQAARLAGFVDLNPVLLDRTDAELFTVDSQQAGYWRLTALDRFDGRTWTQSEEEASAAPPPEPGSALAASEVVQRVRILGLRSRWLPAAYRAEPPRSPDLGVVGASTTLVGRRDSRYGDRYEVASAVPQPTPNALANAGFSLAERGFDRYLALPADLDPAVRRLAARIAGEGAGRASAPSGLPGVPYLEALQLQSFFRTSFTYDLRVAPGSGKDALSNFLFHTKRGYCEQFAAAFAVLARSVGIPARVAIGFTPGEFLGDGLYHVEGRHAHAWPEVNLNGSWVGFEPTPGRGIPGAESYTGVPAMQASGTGPGPGSGNDLTAPTTAPPSTVAPAEVPTTADTTVPGGDSTGDTTPDDPSTVFTTAPGTAAPPKGAPGGAGLPWGAIALVAATVVLVVGAVPAAKRRRRDNRRRRASTPGDRVLVAWAEAAEALAARGMERAPAETLLDHAGRVAGDERLPAGLAEPVLALAGRAGDASYAPGQPPTAEVEQAGADAALIESGLRAATAPHMRLGRAFDPRPLWRGRR